MGKSLLPNLLIKNRILIDINLVLGIWMKSMIGLKLWKKNAGLSKTGVFLPRKAIKAVMLNKSSNG